MSVDPKTYDLPPADPAPEAEPGLRDRSPAVSWPSALVAILALLVGVFATSPLWGDLAGRVVAANVPDAMHYTWWLGHTPHALGEGRSPLFTLDMNWPTGVSAMNNTTLIIPAILLWPVTAAFGSLATLNLLNVISVPACALAMYWALRRLPSAALTSSRRLVDDDAPAGAVDPPVEARVGAQVEPRLTRGAALVGAAAFGISPAIVNSLVGHITMAFAPALPILVLLGIRAWSSSRPVRAGLVLGLVAAVQVLVGEEVLFQAAMGSAFVLLVTALSRPRSVPAGARRLVIALGSAFLVFLPLAGWPLHAQFFGRLHQHGNPFLPDYYGTDLFSFLVPTDQLRLHTAASSAVAKGFPGGIEEHLAYIGLPLAVTALLLVAARPRSLPVRACAVGLLLAGTFSLGGRLWIDGDWTMIRGPYHLLQKLPVIEASLASRFGMLIALFSATLLALAVQALLESRRLPGGLAPLRPWLAAGLAMICLLPLLPRPLDVVDARAIPPFFTSEAPKVPADTVLMVLPYPVPVETVAMRWQSAAGYSFRMPGGYFLGPAFDGHAYVGGDADPVTAQLLAQVDEHGAVPAIGDTERAQARQDLSTLGVDAIVLGPDDSQDALRAAVTDLLQQEPSEVGGVLVWGDPFGGTPMVAPPGSP